MSSHNQSFTHEQNGISTTANFSITTSSAADDCETIRQQIITISATILGLQASLEQLKIELEECEGSSSSSSGI